MTSARAVVSVGCRRAVGALVARGGAGGTGATPLRAIATGALGTSGADDDGPRPSECDTPAVGDGEQPAAEPARPTAVRLAGSERRDLPDRLVKSEFGAHPRPGRMSAGRAQSGGRRVRLRVAHTHVRVDDPPPAERTPDPSAFAGASATSAWTTARAWRPGHRTARYRARGVAQCGDPRLQRGDVLLLQAAGQLHHLHA